MTDDLFLKIVSREIPADIVYETDDVLAFRDVNPQAPLHVLIIPKNRIPTINDMQADNAELFGKGDHLFSQLPFSHARSL